MAACFFYRELKMSRKGEDRAANSSEKHERTLMVRLVSASRATKYAKHPAAGLAFRLEKHFTDPSAALIATRLPSWPASSPGTCIPPPSYHGANGLH